MHYLAFGADNLKNKTAGYTVMNAKGEKILSGCTPRSLTISADASEMIFFSAKSDFNDHPEGVYYCNCRTQEDKRLYEISDKFYPIKTVRNSINSIGAISGNGYLSSAPKDSLRETWFFDGSQFFCLDKNANLITIKLPSNINWFKYIEKSNKIYWQEFPVNSENALYVTDINTAKSTKLADNISCFGAFPDDSGMIYVTQNNELYLAVDNGSTKIIDENVGHPRSGTGLEQRFSIYLIGNTAVKKLRKLFLSKDHRHTM